MDFQSIVQNIIFMEEVFCAGPESEVPDLPFVELAKCFYVQSVRKERQSPQQEKRGP